MKGCHVALPGAGRSVGRKTVRLCRPSGTVHATTFIDSATSAPFPALRDKPFASASLGRRRLGYMGAFLKGHSASIAYRSDADFYVTDTLQLL